MLSAFKRSLAHYLDKAVLYTMNRRVPDSLELSYADAPLFETVLAQTAVNHAKTVEYSLSAPGEQSIWLQSNLGDIKCHVRIRPAVDPQAPLIIYHHGLSEVPYDSSFRRVFPKNQPFPAHLVCVQAPYHHHWRAPFSEGFATVAHIYQMLAGSLRVMELLQNHFEAQGVLQTFLCGVSWGGITSLLYEGLFQRTTAVIPMFASPDLAQVLLDSAELFGRPLQLPPRVLKQLLDFTPYFERCDYQCVYPLLGETDLFFRFQNHQERFAECELVTIPHGHIVGIFGLAPLQQHIRKVFETHYSPKL